MKKLIIGILILFLIIRCNLFYTKDEAKFIVTDFSKKRIDTLMPYKGETYIGGYVTYIIRVKGYTNDSIKIEREGYYDIIL